MSDGLVPDSGPAGPPASGDPRSARPVPVLAAAALGFLLGAYALMYSLLLFTAATVEVVFAAFGAVYLLIAVLGIWGGVQALTGRGSRLLAAGGGVIAVLAVLGIVTSLVGGGVSLWSVVLAAAGAGTVVLLKQPASRAFFASRGTR